MQTKFSGNITEPITLAEAKAYLKVGYDNDDDIITSMITATREHVEAFTHRSLVAKTIEMFLSYVPDEIALPYPDHDTITEVKINGTVSTAYTKTGLNQFIIKPTLITTLDDTDESGFYVKYTTLATCPNWVKIEMLKSIDEKYRNRGNTFEGSITDLSENTYSNLAQYCLM